MTGTVTRESVRPSAVSSFADHAIRRVRASWTRTVSNLGEHLSGWADVMRRFGGDRACRHLERSLSAGQQWRRLAGGDLDNPGIAQPRGYPSVIDTQKDLGWRPARSSAGSTPIAVDVERRR